MTALKTLLEKKMRMLFTDTDNRSIEVGEILYQVGGFTVHRVFGETHQVAVLTPGWKKEQYAKVAFLATVPRREGVVLTGKVIYQAGKSAGFLVRFVGAPSVREHFRNIAVPELDESTKWLLQLVKSVRWLHRQNIVGAFDDETVFIDAAGNVEVGGLHLAQAVGRERGVSVIHPRWKRNERYSSPEELTDPSGDISAESDVYALGVIAHEALTGTHPHQLAHPGAPSITDLIKKGAFVHTESAPENLPAAPRYRPFRSLPAPVRALIEQSLKLDRTSRPTIDEWRKVLTPEPPPLPATLTPPSTTIQKLKLFLTWRKS